MSHEFVVIDGVEVPLCSCGKHLVSQRLHDGTPCCTHCAVRAARKIKRGVKLERRRQRRMFPKTMAVSL